MNLEITRYEKDFIEIALSRLALSEEVQRFWSETSEHQLFLLQKKLRNLQGE